MFRYAALFFLLSTSASAATMMCGESEISVINSKYTTASSGPSKKFFIVTIANQDNVSTHKVTQGLGYLRMRCEQDTAKVSYLLLSPNCSGKSCLGENYLLVDVKSGRVVVEFDKTQKHFEIGSNKAQVETILGRPVPSFDCEYKYEKEIPSAVGQEVCLISARDQG